jgi:hypothetical protein
MTVETRLLVGLQDLISVQFVCKCGARVTRDPDKADRVPHICGQCQLPWRSELTEDSPVFTFAKALAALRQGGTPFSVILEVDGKHLTQP